MVREDERREKLREIKFELLGIRVGDELRGVLAGARIGRGRVMLVILIG